MNRRRRQEPPAPLPESPATAGAATHAVSVGGVDLAACKPGKGPEGMARVDVRVHWSGAALPGQEIHRHEHILMLVRKAGVPSRPFFTGLGGRVCGESGGAGEADPCDGCRAEEAHESAWLLDGVWEGQVLPLSGGE